MPRNLSNSSPEEDKHNIPREYNARQTKIQFLIASITMNYINLNFYQDSQFWKMVTISASTLHFETVLYLLLADTVSLIRVCFLLSTQSKEGCTVT